MPRRPKAPSIRITDSVARTLAPAIDIRHHQLSHPKGGAGPGSFNNASDELRVDLADASPAPTPHRPVADAPTGISSAAGSYTCHHHDEPVDERTYCLQDTIPDDTAPLLTTPVDLTSAARDDQLWEEICWHAQRAPNEVVLSKDGYRFADPAADALANSVRAALLYQVAVTVMGLVADVAAEEAPTFAKTGGHWTQLIQDFRVEDEASLEHLLEACATELGRLPDDVAGTRAKLYLPKALRRCWNAGKRALALNARTEPNWGGILDGLPHALRLGNLGNRSEPVTPWSQTCRV